MNGWVSQGFNKTLLTDIVIESKLNIIVCILLIPAMSPLAEAK